jgi:hypothetical protein
MPERRVQMAWGRIGQPGMPFTQMMLFPTEFSLHRTAAGLRMYAAPIREIDQLHAGTGTQEWQAPTVRQANQNLAAVKPGPMEVQIKFTLAAVNGKGLEFDSEEYGPDLQSLKVYTLQSVWGK